jgi:hypothetical protein
METGRHRQHPSQRKDLPEPEPGVNRIEVEADIPIFQVILGEKLSASTAEAVWIDSGNEASTYALASTGTPDVMHRVRIGRAFTAFQHFHLVNRIESFLNSETKYLVLPNIDQQYREGVSEKERQDLFQSLLEKLKTIARERPEIKILYSFFQEDGSQMVLRLKSLAGNCIEIEQNSQGLREKSKRGDKMFYRDSGTIQTTLPYWRRKRLENPKNSFKASYSGENKLNV